MMKNRWKTLLRHELAPHVPLLDAERQADGAVAVAAIEGFVAPRLVASLISFLLQKGAIREIS